ncbi:MAG: DNA-deoxyinosine glycosylase [Methanolinea sp.]|nr:DNA-deoxyinosine glycosylase [Methanolinea sp.]
MFPDSPNAAGFLDHSPLSTGRFSPVGNNRESGLPPVVGSDPRILIIGSFPSKTSLSEGRYYANPRNQFWQVMKALLGLPEGKSLAWYEQALPDHGIALWDLIASRRYQDGSLDGKIRDPILNDVPGFVRDHPTIQYIGLNGGKAKTCFKVVWRGPDLPPVSVLFLPSTSPANARYSFDEKRKRWREILGQAR